MKITEKKDSINDYLLNKKIKTTTILIFTIVISIALAFFGIV